MKNITFFIFLFVLAIATLFATINPIGISALLNRDTFCYKNIKIKKEKDVRIIDVFDSKWQIYYFLGWIPQVRLSNAKISRDEMTMAVNQKSITIYPNQDVSDIRAACTNRGDCLFSKNNLFGVEGEVYEFSFSKFFFSRINNMLVWLPDTDFDTLDGIKVIGTCN